MATVEIIKNLLMDDPIPDFIVMDSWYMPGLILPPESRKGRGRIRRHRGLRWASLVNREWDCSEDLRRAFVKCLIEAAGQHTGVNKVLSCSPEKLWSYFECTLDDPYAFLMHPTEAKAWGFTEPEDPDTPWTHDKHPHCFKKRDRGDIMGPPVPVPIYAMKEVPQKVILGLSHPEHNGCYSYASYKEDAPGLVRGEFCIVPPSIQGVRRTGKIEK